jgi:hypothetical protein
VKRFIFHPLPVPPPPRGREILFDFQYIPPLPLAGEGRERGNISIFSHLPFYKGGSNFLLNKAAEHGN